MKYQQLTRLFIPSFLENDNVILSSIPDIHYLVNVMRKKVKDQILIFNPTNGEYLAEISAITNKQITFKLIEHVRQATKEQDINLIFAPIKQSRISFLLEKATELGATQLSPIQTHHSVVDKINSTKWQVYVKEAAEQSGRLSIPTIHPLESLDKFLSNWPEDQQIILCNEKENNLHMATFLIKNKPQNINIMIGPEGGLSAKELDLLISKKFITSVHLGTRILRAETASLAALALVDGYLF